MNELIFNGKRLSEFGAFYDSHQAFNTPERELEYVEILGRDGDLIIDNDRFKNIEINFPCYIPTDFLPKYRSLMAYLNSQRGYKRLEYSQEPDHYRMASFAGNVEASPLHLHRAGRFTLPFICKPQRFLKSGEIPVSVSPVTETTSGNPAVIDNMSNLVQVDDLQIAIEPVQDLHGYDSPWVGGAGKNLCAGVAPSSRDASGITYTFVNDGEELTNHITITGTTTANNADSGNKIIGGTNAKPITFKAGQTYSVVMYGVETVPVMRLFLRDSSGTNLWYGDSTTGKWTFTPTEDITVDRYQLRVRNNGSVMNVDAYFQIEEGNTATAWTPYENICPISGHTSATVTSALKNLLQNTSSSSTNHGITFTKQSDSTVVANGTADGDASFIINFTWNLDDGDYQLSGCAEGGSADKYYCFLWDRDANTRAKDWDGNASESSFNPTQIVKVRLEHGVNYGFYLRVKAGVTVNNITFYPMICAKYHGTVYIKYTAKTATIDLGGTRYGGSVDLNSGVLTIDKEFVEVTETSGFGLFDHGTTAAGGYYFGIRKTFNTAELITINPDGYFSHGDYSRTTVAGHWRAYTDTNHRIAIVILSDTDITTTAEANAFLQAQREAGKPLQVLYPLITPTTVQLTPSTLQLASGVTYNFADTGRIVSIRTISPATLTNPTRFDSKPIIRVWGNGTLNVNSYYITVANSPYDYIDIDCELMDCYHGSNNANQYVTFSTTGFVTLNSGANYFGYSGFSGVHVIPRWYEV